MKEKLDQRGLSIPEDISVAAYDNYLYGNPFLENLTTYDVDMDKMVKAGIKVLMKKINGMNQRIGLRIVDGKMLVRGSVNKI